MDLYYLLNRRNDISGPFPAIPHLTPMTPEEFSMIAEQTTTISLDEYQHPKGCHTESSLPTMNEAAPSVTLTHELYHEAPDDRPTSAFTDNIPLQNRPALNTQSPADSNRADEAARHGGQEEKCSKNKKKSGPRYDRMWKCSRCDKKDMELTRAKSHVLKKHAGLLFKDVMVERPRKLRKSSVV